MTGENDRSNDENESEPYYMSGFGSWSGEEIEEMRKAIDENRWGDGPRSPAEPRRGEPYYIDSNCDKCGSELVLYDSLDAADYEESDELTGPEEDTKVWHDEWVCPNCLDGIHLDMPQVDFTEEGGDEFKQ